MKELVRQKKCMEVSEFLCFPCSSGKPVVRRQQVTLHVINRRGAQMRVKLRCYQPWLSQYDKPCGGVMTRDKAGCATNLNSRVPPRYIYLGLKRKDALGVVSFPSILWHCLILYLGDPNCRTRFCRSELLEVSADTEQLDSIRAPLWGT